MARIVRFLLALALLPLCVALPCALWSVVFSASGVFAAEGVPGGGLWLIGGFLAFNLLMAFAPAPVRTYVLGHELTHALWALLFGARVSNLKVATTGGSVTVSKSNVLITLAPYFFPFYTALVMLLACLVGLFVRPLPCIGGWLFAIGATWGFHVFFTVRALRQRQPDVAEYGRLFSWAFIWLANLLGLFLALWAATPLTGRQAAGAIAAAAGTAYRLVGAATLQVVQLVAAHIGGGA